MNTNPLIPKLPFEISDEAQSKFDRLADLESDYGKAMALASTLRRLSDEQATLCKKELINEIRERYQKPVQKLINADAAATARDGEGILDPEEWQRTLTVDFDLDDQLGLWSTPGLLEADKAILTKYATAIATEPIRMRKGMSDHDGHCDDIEEDWTPVIEAARLANEVNNGTTATIGGVLS